MIFDQVVADLEAMAAHVEQGIGQTYEQAKADAGKLMADFAQLWQQSPPPPPDQMQAKAAPRPGPLHQQIRSFVQEHKSKRTAPGTFTQAQPQSPGNNWGNLISLVIQILGLFAQAA
jgi:hypothetical protein